MDAEAREQIIEQYGLPALTDNTITDRDELETELQRVRNRREARDKGEYRADQHCVAVPILDADRNPLGAVSVSGPADRMAEKAMDTDFGSIVGSTANSIQGRLQ
jgi:DNA-binding IclR family transcriptional regulator